MSSIGLISRFLFIQFCITTSFTCLFFSSFLRGDLTINQVYILYFISGFIIFLLLSFSVWFAYRYIGHS